MIVFFRYQEQLPGLVRARKDHQLVYEELVQLTKWKLLRGKFRPSLLDLVKTNTETAVKNVTKKAFKKMPNIASAISALTTLKGVGPATASAILVAYSPDVCPYMADENMLATPGVEATDYTSTEYLNYVQQLNTAVERLRNTDPKGEWTPHKVELALWTHYQIKHYELNSLLEQMPLEKTNQDAEDVDKDQEADDQKTFVEQKEKFTEKQKTVPEQIEQPQIRPNSNDLNCIISEEESNLSAPNSSDSEKSLEPQQNGSTSNECGFSQENSNLSTSNLCYTRIADSACDSPALKRIKVE